MVQRDAFNVRFVAAGRSGGGVRAVGARHAHLQGLPEAVTRAAIGAPVQPGAFPARGPHGQPDEARLSVHRGERSGGAPRGHTGDRRPLRGGEDIQNHRDGPRERVRTGHHAQPLRRAVPRAGRVAPGGERIPEGGETHAANGGEDHIQGGDHPLRQGCAEQREDGGWCDVDEPPFGGSRRGARVAGGVAPAQARQTGEPGLFQKAVEGRAGGAEAVPREKDAAAPSNDHDQATELHPGRAGARGRPRQHQHAPPHRVPHGAED